MPAESPKDVRFATAVSSVFVTFGQDATLERLKAYWLGLSDLTVDAIEQACYRAIRECKRLPVPAELRELAGANGLSAEDQAVAAWEAVQRAVHLGSYRAVDFDDKTINATIRSLGGWPELLARPPEEFDKWVRKDFIQTYRALTKLRLSREAYAALPGLSEAGPVKKVDGTTVDYTPTTARIGSSAAPAPPLVTLSHQDA